MIEVASIKEADAVVAVAVIIRGEVTTTRAMETNIKDTIRDTTKEVTAMVAIIKVVTIKADSIKAGSNNSSNKVTLHYNTEI